MEPIQMTKMRKHLLPALPALFLCWTIGAAAAGSLRVGAAPLADTVVVTLANGMANSGYIPNDAAFGAYTFQVLSSRLKPGCAETAIVNGWLDLLEASSR